MTPTVHPSLAALVAFLHPAATTPPGQSPNSADVKAAVASASASGVVVSLLFSLLSWGLSLLFAAFPPLGVAYAVISGVATFGWSVVKTLMRMRVEGEALFFGAGPVRPDGITRRPGQHLG